MKTFASFSILCTLWLMSQLTRYKPLETLKHNITSGMTSLSVEWFIALCFISRAAASVAAAVKNCCLSSCYKSCLKHDVFSSEQDKTDPMSISNETGSEPSPYSSNIILLVFCSVQTVHVFFSFTFSSGGSQSTFSLLLWNMADRNHIRRKLLHTKLHVYYQLLPLYMPERGFQ